MTCQCEVYEICPECAPSQEAFRRAIAQHDTVLRSVKPSSPSYTADELTALAKDFAHEGKIESMEGALAIGIFLAYLAKRAREEGK